MRHPSSPHQDVGERAEGRRGKRRATPLRGGGEGDGGDRRRREGAHSSARSADADTNAQPGLLQPTPSHQTPPARHPRASGAAAGRRRSNVVGRRQEGALAPGKSGRAGP